MRLLLAAVAMAPMVVYAADQPGEDWHFCNSDAECVLVDGICGKAAVNIGFEKVAAKFYAEKAKTAKCNSSFWQPKDAKAARCRYQSCEIVYN